MIRRLFVSFVFFAAFQVLYSQESRFGFIDFNGTLRQMPEYADAETSLRSIQLDYNEEIERSKREFERQYIEFMLEQDHLSASIVAKRQKELQLLMDNNAQFRDNIQSELEARRDELLTPIKKKLLEAVSKVCISENLDYVVDTGKGTYLFINPEKGVDITDPVYSLLGIEKKTERVVEGEQPVINTNKTENSVVQ